MGNTFSSAKPDEGASQNTSSGVAPEAEFSSSFSVISSQAAETSTEGMGANVSIEEGYEKIPEKPDGDWDTKPENGKEGSSKSTFQSVITFFKNLIWRKSDETSKLRVENNNLRDQILGKSMELESKDDTIKNQARQIQALREEKGLLNRLSTMAGVRLKSNNPGITDLSDDNRPSKLAERFSELYDNEWTEAFEALQQENGLLSTEEDIINQLVKLIEDVYHQCQELASRQRDTLTVNIFNPEASTMDSVTVDAEQLPSGNGTRRRDEFLDKKVSDFQKEIAQYSLQGIQKRMPNKDGVMAQHESCIRLYPKYFRKCVELCWFMSIQDPPLFIDFSAKKGAKNDAVNWREYTKSGSTVDFMVWPALFLHKNGPLLCKGVIQPTDMLAKDEEKKDDVNQIEVLVELNDG